jgi:hypothetical protein
MWVNFVFKFGSSLADSFYELRLGAAIYLCGFISVYFKVAFLVLVFIIWRILQLTYTALFKTLLTSNHYYLFGLRYGYFTVYAVY